MRTFVVALLVAVALACQAPDCDRQDCGSCGNACCKLGFTVELSTVDAKNALQAVLAEGGPDGRYAQSMTAEGTLGFADLRPYKVGVDFIGQAIHTTAVKHFNDTINFTFESVGANKTTVTAFSISQIAGAYCDAGQGYKNIVSVIKAANLFTGEKTLLGCPAPATVALA